MVIWAFNHQQMLIFHQEIVWDYCNQSKHGGFNVDFTSPFLRSVERIVDGLSSKNGENMGK